MKFIDLFSGVGGFRFGIIKAHPDWECVYSNEWDKYANSVYRKHFGECDNRDISTVPTADIPDHDLLVGGFPCQSFSVAGKRGGFNDTRGTMFFEIARILTDKRPRLVLLENVKGLLSHDSGKTFQTILGVLTDLGYDCQWQVLNSKDFGVPQNRERVFIVGHLRGTPRPQVFPLGSYDQKNTRPEQVAKDSYSETVSTRTGSTAGGQQFIAIPVLTPDRAEKRQNGRRFKNNGEPSFTLTQQDQHGVMVAKQPHEVSNTVRSGGKGSTTAKHAWDLVQDTQMVIRRLTPTECERLQGFLDNWTAFDADGKPVSDTQRYKMMGNAVTTTVITAIMEKI